MWKTPYTATEYIKKEITIQLQQKGNQHKQKRTTKKERKPTKTQANK